MFTPHIYTPQSLALHTTIELEEKKSHHLNKVLRVKPNDKITLFNGDGYNYEGTVKEIKHQQVTIHIHRQSAHQQESPCHVQIIQGLCRFDKMDWIVQKVTELGASAIYPCPMAHTDIHIKGERALKKQQHWQNIAIAACEQSKRQNIPQIAPIQKFADLIPKLAKTSTLCVLDPYGDHSQWPLSPQSVITLIIGPEGGFHDEELALLQQHQAHAIKLGPRVLRTETATITATCLAQHHYGDLTGSSPN